MHLSVFFNLETTHSGWTTVLVSVATGLIWKAWKSYRKKAR